LRNKDITFKKYIIKVMGFKQIIEESSDKYTLVKFIFEENFTKDDFNKFLGILSMLLTIAEETKKPFGFYIDAQKSYIAPLNAAKNLISWKRKETARIRECKKLIASSVAIKSESLTSMINSALKIAPNVSPNIITSDVDNARKFVLAYLQKL